MHTRNLIMVLYADPLNSSHFAIMALLVVAGSLYICARPKPLPGIPYNKDALGIFGDLPAVKKHISEHNVFVRWMALQAEKHQSPIIQLFLRPFSSPAVVICDYRETQDILLRRGKVFDRADLQGDLFRPLVPNHHIHMKTDVAFKAHRKLIQDLMTPAFLNEVAAPAVHLSAANLVKLWNEKIRLAHDRPFEISADLFRGALDAVLAFTFGSHFAHNATKQQLDHLSQVRSIDVTTDTQAVAEMPTKAEDKEIQAILTFTHAADDLISSPFPAIAYAFVKMKPSWRRNMDAKEGILRKEIGDTLARRTNDPEHKVRSAVDHIIERETLLAKKQGREPNYYSGAIRDELMGFVVAGHETTSTTLSWAVKLLADYPQVQTKLRDQLRYAMKEAVNNNRWPTAHEIMHSNMPYLDACVEELLRCACTVPFVVRQATTNTHILGRFIPKGTSVYMVMEGPSVFSPAFEIADTKRTQSALESTQPVRSWNPVGMSEFSPERWLAPLETESGDSSSDFENMSFDMTSGPSFPFGLGVRGCFGRRLAYLEMRLLLVLILWNFELKQCPKELSSYKANEGFTRRPVQCFARLEKLA
ncbi:Steroid 21-hydroxylase [Paramyrothecium foliicola]|nr:Steroid 21-hydroxylase [Paramyrothecium foliicola]